MAHGFQQPGWIYKALRKRHGWTQGHVAGELAVSQPWITQLESGLRRVPMEDRGGCDRGMLDSALALGEWAAGDRLFYLLAVRRGRTLDFDYVSVDLRYDDRDQADGEAAAVLKALASGPDAVAVVPHWSSVPYL